MGENRVHVVTDVERERTEHGERVCNCSGRGNIYPKRGLQSEHAVGESWERKREGKWGEEL